MVNAKNESPPIRRIPAIGQCMSLNKAPSTIGIMLSGYKNEGIIFFLNELDLDGRLKYPKGPSYTNQSMNEAELTIANGKW
jgi:hypothetical protein